MARRKYPRVYYFSSGVMTFDRFQLFFSFSEGFRVNRVLPAIFEIKLYTIDFEVNIRNRNKNSNRPIEKNVVQS